MKSRTKGLSYLLAFGATMCLAAMGYAVDSYPTTLTLRNYEYRLATSTGAFTLGTGNFASVNPAKNSGVEAFQPGDLSVGQYVLNAAASTVPADNAGGSAVLVGSNADTSRSSFALRLQNGATKSGPFMMLLPNGLTTAFPKITKDDVVIVYAVFDEQGTATLANAGNAGEVYTPGTGGNYSVALVLAGQRENTYDQAAAGQSVVDLPAENIHFIGKKGNATYLAFSIPASYCYKTPDAGYQPTDGRGMPALQFRSTGTCAAGGELTTVRIDRVVWARYDVTPEVDAVATSPVLDTDRAGAAVGLPVAGNDISLTKGIAESLGDDDIVAGNGFGHELLEQYVYNNVTKSWEGLYGELGGLPDSFITEEGRVDDTTLYLNIVDSTIPAYLSSSALWTNDTLNADSGKILLLSEGPELDKGDNPVTGTPRQDAIYVVNRGAFSGKVVDVGVDGSSRLAVVKPEVKVKVSIKSATMEFGTDYTIDTSGSLNGAPISGLVGLAVPYGYVDPNVEIISDNLKSITLTVTFPEESVDVASLYKNVSLNDSYLFDDEFTAFGVVMVDNGRFDARRNFTVKIEEVTATGYATTHPAKMGKEIDWRSSIFLSNVQENTFGAFNSGDKGKNGVSEELVYVDDPSVPKVLVSLVPYKAYNEENSYGDDASEGFPGNKLFWASLDSAGREILYTSTDAGYTGANNNLLIDDPRMRYSLVVGMRDPIVIGNNDTYQWSKMAVFAIENDSEVADVALNLTAFANQIASAANDVDAYVLFYNNERKDSFDYYTTSDDGLTQGPFWTFERIRETILLPDTSTDKKRKLNAFITSDGAILKKANFTTSTAKSAALIVVVAKKSSSFSLYGDNQVKNITFQIDAADKSKSMIDAQNNTTNYAYRLSIFQTNPLGTGRTIGDPAGGDSPRLGVAPLAKSNTRTIRIVGLNRAEVPDQAGVTAANRAYFYKPLVWVEPAYNLYDYDDFSDIIPVNEMPFFNTVVVQHRLPQHGNTAWGLDYENGKSDGDTTLEENFIAFNYVTGQTGSNKITFAEWGDTFITSYTGGEKDGTFIVNGASYNTTDLALNKKITPTYYATRYSPFPVKAAGDTTTNTNIPDDPINSLFIDASCMRVTTVIIDPDSLPTNPASSYTISLEKSPAIPTTPISPENVLTQWTSTVANNFIVYNDDVVDCDTVDSALDPASGNKTKALVIAADTVRNVTLGLNQVTISPKWIEYEYNAQPEIAAVVTRLDLPRSIPGSPAGYVAPRSNIVFFTYNADADYWLKDTVVPGATTFEGTGKLPNFLVTYNNSSLPSDITIQAIKTPAVDKPHFLDPTKGITWLHDYTSLEDEDTYGLVASTFSAALPSQNLTSFAKPGYLKLTIPTTVTEVKPTGIDIDTTKTVRTFKVAAPYNLPTIRVIDPRASFVTIAALNTEIPELNVSDDGTGKPWDAELDLDNPKLLAFTLTRDGPTDNALTVNIHINAGGSNATYVTDFLFYPTTYVNPNTLLAGNTGFRVTIPENRSSIDIIVMPKADNLIEGLEDITVTIDADSTNPGGLPYYDLGAVYTANVKIKDSAPELSLTANQTFSPESTIKPAIRYFDANPLNVQCGPFTLKRFGGDTSNTMEVLLQVIPTVDSVDSTPDAEFEVDFYLSTENITLNAASTEFNIPMRPDGYFHIFFEAGDVEKKIYVRPINSEYHGNMQVTATIAVPDVTYLVNPDYETATMPVVDGRDVTIRVSKLTNNAIYEQTDSGLYPSMSVLHLDIYASSNFYPGTDGRTLTFTVYLGGSAVLARNYNLTGAAAIVPVEGQPGYYQVTTTRANVTDEFNPELTFSTLVNDEYSDPETFIDILFTDSTDNSYPYNYFVNGYVDQEIIIYDRSVPAVKFDDNSVNIEIDEGDIQGAQVDFLRKGNAGINDPLNVTFKAYSLNSEGGQILPPANFVVANNPNINYDAATGLGTIVFDAKSELSSIIVSATDDGVRTGDEIVYLEIQDPLVVAPALPAYGRVEPYVSMITITDNTPLPVYTLVIGAKVADDETIYAKTGVELNDVVDIIVYSVAVEPIAGAQTVTIVDGETSNTYDLIPVDRDIPVMVTVDQNVDTDPVLSSPVTLAKDTSSVSIIATMNPEWPTEEIPESIDVNFDLIENAENPGNYTVNAENGTATITVNQTPVPPVVPELSWLLNGEASETNSVTIEFNGDPITLSLAATEPFVDLYIVKVIMHNDEITEDTEYDFTFEVPEGQEGTNLISTDLVVNNIDGLATGIYTYTIQVAPADEYTIAEGGDVFTVTKDEEPIPVIVLPIVKLVATTTDEAGDIIIMPNDQAIDLPYGKIVSIYAEITNAAEMTELTENLVVTVIASDSEEPLTFTFTLPIDLDNPTSDVTEFHNVNNTEETVTVTYTLQSEEGVYDIDEENSVITVNNLAQEIPPPVITITVDANWLPIYKGTGNFSYDATVTIEELPAAENGETPTLSVSYAILDSQSEIVNVSDKLFNGASQIPVQSLVYRNYIAETAEAAGYISDDMSSKYLATLNFAEAGNYSVIVTATYGDITETKTVIVQIAESDLKYAQIGTFSAGFYWIGLTRIPNAELQDLTAWITKLYNQETSGFEYAVGVFVSPEMLGMRYLSDGSIGVDSATFIERMYLACLGRDNDAAGQARYLQMLDEEAYTWQEVLLQFTNSEEFNGKCGNILIKSTDDAKWKTYLAPYYYIHYNYTMILEREVGDEIGFFRFTQQMIHAKDGEDYEGIRSSVYGAIWSFWFNPEAEAKNYSDDEFCEITADIINTAIVDSENNPAADTTPAITDETIAAAKAGLAEGTMTRDDVLRSYLVDNPAVQTWADKYNLAVILDSEQNAQPPVANK